MPRFVQAAKSVRYVTASKLPDRFPNAAFKTERFRDEITKACRGRDGWDDLLDDIAHENVLFGYTSAVWSDSYSWFPRAFGQDALLVPSNTKHTASSCQVLCVRESFLAHTLFEVIQNREAAKIAGWIVPEVIASINAASDEKVRSTASDMERVYADLQRQCSVATSFTGSRTVDVWHVYVVEVDGRVTHIAFDDKSKKALFWKEKQFARLSDVCAFYSFQRGNGKLQGSKGLGRELYSMAAVLDRSRNEVVDRLQLSGKILFSAAESDIRRFRMSVVGNAILVSSAFTAAQQRVDGNVEAFVALDQFITGLLDQAAGATSPKAFEGERVTKAAVELFASREEERRDVLLDRFLTQFARMVSTLQRRLCSEQCYEADAREVQARLLEVMTREELDYLANQPAVSTVLDYTDAERQQIAIIATEARGNPLYNQRELERRQLTAKVGSDFADSVLLPENDPTEQAEQTRMQQLELSLLSTGQEVPVSSRDNHLIHLSVLQTAIENLAQQAATDAPAEAQMTLLAAHAEQHLQLAEAQGQGKQVAEFKKWLGVVNSSLDQLYQNPVTAAPNGSPAPVE